LNPKQHNYTNAFSRITGRLARLKSPYFIIKLFIKWYINHYKIDIDLYRFKFEKGITFNEFFVRQKKHIPEFDKYSICSPADGKIVSSGSINNGLILPVKGQSLKFEDLTDEKLLEQKQYSYYNIYLSPADYHRFHAPFDMEIEKLKYFKGKLMSVNPKIVKKHENLYCNNERVVLKGKWERGVFWMILVGAFNVGDIELKFCNIRTNRKNANSEEIVFQKPVVLDAGKEVGKFNFGSTVILVLDIELFTSTQFSGKIVKIGNILKNFIQ